MTACTSFLAFFAEQTLAFAVKMHSRPDRWPQIVRFASGRADSLANRRFVNDQNRAMFRAVRVLTKSRKNEALIRDDGMYVISGIFSRANACKKVKARRAEVASTRSAQARNTAQAKRRGARRPPPVAETGRSKPNEAGRATSELASAVERPC